jgi:hypothetical protein
MMDADTPFEVEEFPSFPEEIDLEVDPFAPEIAVPDTGVIGDPVDDAEFYHWQEADDTCAIVAQEGILEKETGVPFDEAELAQEAEQLGVYFPGVGTTMDGMGVLLESHGIPVTEYMDGSADASTLARELNEGHEAIVGVDCGILWNDPFAVGQGHAIWITGVEVDEMGDVTGVFANDSGIPDGGGVYYDIDTFQSAWNSMGSPMVATQV